MGTAYVESQRDFFKRKEDLSTKFILKNLPDLKGKSVLDFGCGHGKMIKKLEKMRAKELLGIDESEVMIKEAKGFLGRSHGLFVKDIQKTGFKDKYFDAVVGRFALHYLDSFEKAYREIARILKRGGVLIFVVDHPLRDLQKKKSKSYWKQEEIKIRLYDGKVAIRFPSHTIGDYFSKEFFKHFYVDNFEEDVSLEAQTKKELPDYLAVRAIRK